MKISTLKIRLITATMAVFILLSSCASTTLIDSYPSGAFLYLDGEAVGQTPYQMTDTKPMFTSTSVRIEKENFSPFYTTICRNEEADPGAIIGGFFCWFPLIWAFKYKPTHFYRLRADENGNENGNETLDVLIEKEKAAEEE